jgi:arginine:ornithine antiporter/lysine permease
MVGVFQSVVGHWGEVFISVAVIVSVLGAYLAWTLMAAEVMYIPARQDDFPQFLGQENAAGTPINVVNPEVLQRALKDKNGQPQTRS